MFRRHAVYIAFRLYSYVYAAWEFFRQSGSALISVRIFLCSVPCVAAHVVDRKLCSPDEELERERRIAPVRGDVNLDGMADVNDVTTLINYILGAGGSPFDKTEADFNGDGVIDVTDATAIINFVLN